MALPVPYTMNWLDHFGNQNFPAEEDGGSTGPTAPLAASIAVAVATATLTVTGSPGATYNVDWGDGTVDTGVASGAQHTYDRLGDFGVTVVDQTSPFFHDNTRAWVQSLA